ncbi:tetratricopeptide repeat protein [Novosphingobium sp.]|uniref:tetratricopeptide repeat protein n=1 Tax=Novosphingobium sp. TaxID=1874826 RepID=UPI0033418A99
MVIRNVRLKQCGAAFALAMFALIPTGVQAETGPAPAPASPSDVVRFVVEGDLAGVLIRAPDGTIKPVAGITRVKDALKVLADERLAAVWPDLLAWAGSDLRRLRDRSLAQTESALNDQSRFVPTTLRERQALWPKKLLAFTQYLDALSDAGKISEAIALAQAEITTPAIAQDALDTGQIQVKLATLFERSGAVDSAIGALQQAAATTSDQSAIENINVNLAAKLAIAGNYARALTLINAEERGYDQISPAKLFQTGRHMPDSHAYFAAIRACALNGLGNHEEAMRMLALIEPDPETPFTESVRSQTRLRAYRCMHDAAGLAAELAPLVANAAPGSVLMIELQPGYQTDPAERETVAKALTDARLVHAMAGRARVLGEPYASAIAWWNVAPVSPGTPKPAN